MGIGAITVTGAAVDVSVGVDVSVCVCVVVAGAAVACFGGDSGGLDAVGMRSVNNSLACGGNVSRAASEQTRHKDRTSIQHTTYITSRSLSHTRSLPTPVCLASHRSGPLHGW